MSSLKWLDAVLNLELICIQYVNRGEVRSMERIVRKLDKKILAFAQRKRVAAYARVSSGKDAMLHSLSAQVSY